MHIRFPSGIMADSWSRTRRTTRSLLRRFLSSIVLEILSRHDLVMSSRMLPRSPDRQGSPDGPKRCYQADRGDSRTSDKVKFHVPFRVGSRFVQEIGPGQEENSR